MNTDLTRWNSALETCLKAVLEDGQPVEQAISSFPDLAGDLRPELETALWLRKQRQTLSAYRWEIGQGRRRLENRLLLQRPDWAAYWRRLSLIKRSFQAAVLFLLLVSLAQFNSKVAYASDASIPGDPFYPVKLAREQAQLAFTFNQEDEARALIEIARQRSVELESLVLEGRYDDIAKISSQVDLSFERAQRQIDKIPVEKGSEELSQEFRDTVEIQKAVLSAMVGMVPPDTRNQLTPLLNDEP